MVECSRGPTNHPKQSTPKYAKLSKNTPKNTPKYTVKCPQNTPKYPKVISWSKTNSDYMMTTVNQYSILQTRITATGSITK